MKKLLSALFVIALLAGAAAYLYIAQTLANPGPLVEDKIVYVAPGKPTKAIAQMLFDEGVVSSAGIFTFGARLNKVRGGLRAGEYEIPPHISMNDIIALLQSGKTYQRKITIAEGLMSVEIMQLINDAPAMEGKIETIPAEGSLLPETYSYTYGEDRNALITRMQKAMNDALDTLWSGRVGNLPFSTKEEAVTLASVVERETGIDSERPRVAGVFINRLRKNMALQSDPTAIYAITEGKYKFDRALSRKDLEIQSPYNTYVTPGLPPGPIANPGRAALEAVMHPEDNGYFYFVADGTGGHAFAETLEGHSKNVAKWRELQRKSR